nr:DUF1266 domain-containing protein [Metabacillus lacus]
MLLANFNIVDKATAKESIDLMLHTGLRAEYNLFSNMYVFMSEGEKDQYTANHTDPRVIYKNSIVRYYLNRLPAAGIAAYDYSTVILTAHAASIFRYISRKERIAYELAAANLAQQSYSSWEEYIIAHTSGFQFSCPDEEHLKATMLMHKLNLIKMIAYRGSPISNLDWRTKLDVV